MLFCLWTNLRVRYPRIKFLLEFQSIFLRYLNILKILGEFLHYINSLFMPELAPQGRAEAGDMDTVEMTDASLPDDQVIEGDEPQNEVAAEQPVLLLDACVLYSAPQYRH